MGNRAYYDEKRGRRRHGRGKLLLVAIVCIAALAAYWTLAEETGAGAAAPRIDIGEEGLVPLLLQTDERWGSEAYGDSDIAASGCGPTCIAMIAQALLDDGAMTPPMIANFSEKQGYFVAGAGTSWQLMTEGAAKLGLRAEEVGLDKNLIDRHLEQGNPIIVAVGKGDFTAKGHFIILSGVADDGALIVRDPNSLERSTQSWDYDKIKDQFKCLWAYTIA